MGFDTHSSTQIPTSETALFHICSDVRGKEACYSRGEHRNTEKPGQRSWNTLFKHSVPRNRSLYSYSCESNAYRHPRSHCLLRFGMFLKSNISSFMTGHCDSRRRGSNLPRESSSHDIGMGGKQRKHIEEKFILKDDTWSAFLNSRLLHLLINQNQKRNSQIRFQCNGFIPSRGSVLRIHGHGRISL